jgi:hypothetical protein
MQELVARVKNALTEPWNKKVGRPKSCGLYAAVEVACMYLRQNGTEEFLGDLRDMSQPTVSRIVTTLVPIVKAVLEEVRAGREGGGTTQSATRDSSAKDPPPHSANRPTVNCWAGRKNSTPRSTKSAT